MAGGEEAMVATMVEGVGHTSYYRCRQEVRPAINGWFSNIMVQAGETAKLVCDLEVTNTK